MENTQGKMGYMEHALTRRMESVTNSLKQKYTSLYNRRDFVNKIKYLSRCPRDEASAEKVKLSRMFKKCGIDSVNVDGTPEYYEQLLNESDIPKPSQMTHSVYESFLKEFTENPFPLPEEYIERMVDGKIDEEWKNDSLRVKILKKIVRDAGSLSAAGYSDRCIKDYVRKKIGKKNFNNEEIVEVIEDDIFMPLREKEDDYLKSVEDARNNRDYWNVLRKKREKELESKLEREIGNKSEAFKKKLKEEKDKDPEYIRSVIHYWPERRKKLVKEIRLRLEREIGNKSEEFQKKLEDEIKNDPRHIECLKNLKEARKYIDNEKKKKKQKSNNSLKLLKIADDLASGRFGNPDVVREEIYIFSIVFELTYFIGDPEEIVTEETRTKNIEKVMFGDYYANNLMRYVSSNHANLKKGGEIQEPSGKGINYKNYMEVIFLYYLRRVDLTVIKRLEGVYSMAKEVHDKYMATERVNAEKLDRENMTQFYTESFKSLELEDEDEFIDYLVKNYDCRIEPAKTPVFNIEAEQRTAVNEYKLLLEDAYESGVDEENYLDNGIVFLEDEIDISKIKELQSKRESGTFNFDELDEKTKFDILLYEVNRNLGKIKTESDLDKGIVTRTDILKLYYHMYINDLREEKDAWLRSFSEVYDDFTLIANKHLTSAYLRPITGRDLYDLILIYSAYCNINAEKLMDS